MKVAILIPTLNRPSFIKRLVLYYDSLKCSHPIYIGDASNTEIYKNVLVFLKNVKNVEVKYFHWEGLNYELTLTKLAEEASVECEFCAHHGDDDYLIPSSVTKCAEFLSKNPGYKTVQGNAALVVMNKPEPVCNIKWIGEYWGENSLEGSSKMERLLFFHKNYYGMQLSTHRVKEFIADCNDFSTITQSGISETLHSYTFAMNGKSKFIDCLYLIRVRHPDLLLNSDMSFFDSITDENWSQDYNKMIDSLSLVLSNDKKISFPEAKKIISEMMIENMKIECFKSLKNKQHTKSKNVLLGYLKHILLDKMGLRPVRESFRTKNNMQLWVAKGSRFHSEFLPIKNSLTGKKHDKR